MQVFGLSSHIIRDAVARWRRAMADGLSAEQAARAVGVARPTRYRWERRPEPLSRRPHHPRELARAVEDVRNGNPASATQLRLICAEQTLN